LYFHAPCFDGIVSSVLTTDFLETTQGWRFQKFCAVGYDLRSCWMSTGLPEQSAVVDFLYHPRATFWADHHATTFITTQSRIDYQNKRGRRWLYYDERSASCASLLWQYLFISEGYRNPKYQELVEWADKIDAARYASVEEAILGQDPALRIRASLAGSKDQGYYVRLIKALRVASLDEVAEQPEVKQDSVKIQAKIEAGLQRFQNAARIDDHGIVVFDVKSDDKDVIISRYAPYLLFPHARYSVGITRSSDGVKITGMRNPWREFASLPLGEIFKRFGGGGHQRVAALMLPRNRVSEAREVLEKLISEVHNNDAMSDVVATISK
jgi:hypothetical protein